MRYLPHTQDEIAAMLAKIGKTSIDQLFEQIPEEVRLARPLAIDAPLDEPTLMQHLDELSRKNRGAELLSFLGAGAYDHPISPAVDQLLLRSEFYTAYTPYQPEVAQGTLQAIFEFQTIVSELFGLPVANASMYDGASAAAEAVLMAKRLTKRERVLVSSGIHPHYRATIDTYLQGIGPGKEAIGALPLGDDGRSNLGALEELASEELAAVVIGYPNFYGCVTEVRKLAEIAHRHGALLITVTQEPFALSVLESPGELGADIAVGEGQALGIPLQFGGPYAGLFACRDGRDFLQQIPGRLAGETVDKNGERGYVLTLSTREQHIRRERATSNICTNTGLCALAITIRMCMLGKQGFLEAGRQCLAKAEYLKSKVRPLPGYSLVYPNTPTFNEFALRVRGNSAGRVVDLLEPKGFLAGLDLGRVDPRRADQLLVAVTERATRADLDAFAAALAAI
ncbi:MAG TPA: aminomethyl-transferring glycine dehydrogenase subunit GcvPA [Polyangiaceae bacterium]|nr:aminomethyl-transferring glycine dehydrogenase subunit GcvPA [Polyangiaceae bacterium]